MCNENIMTFKKHPKKMLCRRRQRRLGLKTKESLQSNNLIGLEVFFGPMQLTLGFELKV